MSPLSPNLTAASSSLGQTWRAPLWTFPSPGVRCFAFLPAEASDRDDSTDGNVCGPLSGGNDASLRRGWGPSAVNQIRDLRSRLQMLKKRLGEAPNAKPAHDLIRKQEIPALEAASAP